MTRRRDIRASRRMAAALDWHELAGDPSLEEPEGDEQEGGDDETQQDETLPMREGPPLDLRAPWRLPR